MPAALRFRTMSESGAQPDRRTTRERVASFLVADAGLGRDALALLLERSSRISVIGASPPGRASAEVAALRPDVVLVDVAAPDALAAVRELDQMRGLDTNVIALGELDDDRAITVCIACGAGYIARHATPDHLVAAIEMSARGELVCSTAVARVFERARERALSDTESAAAVLTPREREILGLVEEGLSDKQIAGRLHIEVRTVKNHMQNIFGKVGVRGRMAVLARLRAGRWRREPDRP